MRQKSALTFLSKSRFYCLNVIPIERQLMQTMKRVATSLTHFAWDILLPESVLLIAIALLWRWTVWHTTTSYGTALSTAGGIITGVGVMALTGRGGSNDITLAEGEVEMCSWDRNGQRRFTSPYAERARPMSWLIALGLLTVGMGIVSNSFFP
jgi:hypothetical protein